MAVGKGDVYRVCRWLHGYLSAFAFLALMFFSVTGLVLNHPDWTRSMRPRETISTVMVEPAAASRAASARDPGPALAALVSAKAPLVGRVKSGEMVDQQAFLRLEGTKGSTDVVIDLKTGRAEVSVARAPALTLLNELHKGRDSGAAWKAFIDLSAIVFCLLSLVGYVLFFSLRFRLRSSLVVTAVSLLLMAGLVLFLTS
jgi:hypothetical protein